MEDHNKEDHDELNYKIGQKEIFYINEEEPSLEDNVASILPLSSVEENFNKQVDMATLPRLESIDFTKLQEDYLYVGYINSGIIGLLVLVFVAMVGFFSETLRPYILWGYLGVILFFAFLMYAEYRSYMNSGYALREEDLFYKTGWIWTSMIAIPYKRIQHLEITQGPVSRLFDLANVSVYTAGGSSSDMEIEGIMQEQAESIKAYILQKNKNVKTENTEDAV